MSKASKAALFAALILVGHSAVAQSVSSSLGLVVYPDATISRQQIAKDEGECHAWARQNTGIDPANPMAGVQVQQAPPPGGRTGRRRRGSRRGEGRDHRRYRRRGPQRVRGRRRSHRSGSRSQAAPSPASASATTSASPNPSGRSGTHGDVHESVRGVHASAQLHGPLVRYAQIRPLDCAPSCYARNATERRILMTSRSRLVRSRPRLRCSVLLRNRGAQDAPVRGDGAAEDRSRARRRRSERRRAHRSAAGSRRAAHSRRLRRRHEHGRARRRDVRDRHASRGDPARGARDRLGAHHRRPGPARPHADQAQARDDDLHAAARGRDEQQRNTHAGRAHRHAGDRAVHPHARRAVPLHERFRRAADSVSRRRNRHGRRARSWSSTTAISRRPCARAWRCRACSRP